METFSRGQQGVVLLIIFGMTLLYFHSINLQSGRQSAVGSQQIPYSPINLFTDSSKPATDHRPLTTAKLSGAQLLTLNKKINLNTATKNDLAAISGIGPKTAERIIDYRKEHGTFVAIEEIMRVPGIKEKRFEKIKRFLTVK